MDKVSKKTAPPVHESVRNVHWPLHQRSDAPKFQRLDDLTAVDESARQERGQYPDYTLVYQLLSFESASRVRLKVPLYGSDPVTGSITDLWPSANWYEREVYDLFGIRFEGHPDLRRLLMPHDWEGHPLRKSYPGPRHRDAALHPPGRPKAPAPGRGQVPGRAESGRTSSSSNVGPHHVSTHGLLRFIVALTGEEITAPGPGHRLPSPGRGKDRRAPVLAPVHPLHGPGGLPGRRRQQPALPAGPWRPWPASRSPSGPR